MKLKKPRKKYGIPCMTLQNHVFVHYFKYLSSFNEPRRLKLVYVIVYI